MIADEIKAQVQTLVERSGYQIATDWKRGFLVGETIPDDYLSILTVRNGAMRAAGKALKIGVSLYPVNSATYDANGRIGFNICCCDPIEPQLLSLANELGR